MYEAKTKPTDASVAAHLAAIADETRRDDCQALVALMERVTGCPPRMWGASIVGFDRYQYKYASGHQGESCVVGFAARKGDISVYILPGYEEAERLLARLGKHKMGKACLYIKKLADVDMKVLEELVRGSWAETRKRHPRVEGE